MDSRNKVFMNGIIYTMDGRICEAMAVEEDRILQVGSQKEIMQLVNKSTQMIDMNGKTMLPGFIDTHTHLVGYGISLMTVNLSDADGIEDIIERCRRYIEEHKVTDKQWIIGRGWNQNNFGEDPRFPNRHDLDKISTKNPILLLRTCGHIGSVNSLALEEVGVDKHTHIAGGSFDCDNAGLPNGIIREASLEWFKKNRCVVDDHAYIRKGILKGSAELLKYGITSVHTEDSYDLGYSGDFEHIAETYGRMAKMKELPIRIYQKISLPKKEDILRFLQGSNRTGQGDFYYKTGPIKQWCDGTIGARTAALRKDYSDDPGNKGILVYEKQELYENVKLAHEENMQVCLHSIGDASLEMIIEAYEKVQKENPKNLRHRIVHCQVGDRKLYERLKKINVCLNIQTAQTATDWSMMSKRIGNDREKDAHNWRILTDMGICLTGGSDIPVETPDVFYGIYAAVNRKDREGNPKNGWLPEQALTVEEAIKTYTVNAAYASYEENDKGSLTEGKLADMVLVDKDPFVVDPMELKDISVCMTMVGGEIKWSKE
ncbi:amidohydrolase [Tindallia californiensis]|uniref:Amidohydrolase 3 domain-containing protein n=1 Tax=Tindallia californiensis TaxID=159292 RepID=A0A1H3KAL1_9FIRM|nr:amidohydrolase [Tindallia californiensis]SDY48825.1 hypothetical protein SAMN05192546_102277 [Tindallia californiensis]